MNRLHLRLAALLAGPVLLAGCTTPTPDAALSDAQRWAQRAGAPPPRLLTPEQQAAERRRLLQGPLDETTAVQLALGSSPGLQALLADGWRLQADTAAAAAWPRVGLAFERLRQGDDTVWTRSLSIGLAELLTLPMRQAAADRRLQGQRLQLARDLLGLHAAVRAQWVRAVAARQQLVYRRQVQQVAQAGAELARRMQDAGNFSGLRRAQEDVFRLDADAQLARAQAVASAETEALVRLLGLDAAEAAALQWPDRLPDLPAQPREAVDVRQAALDERLDLQLAWADWRAASGAPAWQTLVDAELTLARERGPGSERARSTELALALPLPGEAALRLQARDAAATAAWQRLEQTRRQATSNLRERFAAYQAAHAIARQYRDQVLPLRQQITDDRLRRYNGMLDSVFLLLAEARAQVGAVIGALDAERDFALARVALDAAILGVPAAGTLPAAAAADTEARGGH